MPQSKVLSPCIGVCSTGIGDSVCRGCKRFCHEIINWNAYKETEKRSIQDRLDALLSQVVSSKIQIVDETKLKSQLSLQNIRFDEKSSPYCWLFTLLKAGATQINCLDDFGCRFVSGHQTEDFVDLRESIDADFYILSSVHYERYFNED